MGFKVSAPGKIILSGEHAVVYGYPAIAAAVNRRLTVDSDGRIASDIPIGCGMGSSATLAVAQAALKIKETDLEKVNKLAYSFEKKHHGNPSGVDNTVSTYGGFVWYRKESESFKTFKKILPKVRLSKLYLVNTGKPQESTKEMVKYVGGLRKARRTFVDGIFKEIEAVTRGFLDFLLNESKQDFGGLIRENEKLLEKLGVVSESTKSLIRRIEKIRGFAKISGAGGRKEESGMVLIYHKDIDLKLMSVKLGEEGVRIE